MTDQLRVLCRWDGAAILPARFGPAGGEHQVAEILDRWPGEDYTYFKVRTTEDDLYILRYDESEQGWEIWVFREGESWPDGWPDGG